MDLLALGHLQNPTSEGLFRGHRTNQLKEPREESGLVVTVWVGEGFLGDLRHPLTIIRLFGLLDRSWQRRARA